MKNKSHKKILNKSGPKIDPWSTPNKQTNKQTKCHWKAECHSLHFCSAWVPNGTKSVDVNGIVIVESLCKEDPLFRCSSVFISFAIDIINENNLEMPINIIEARHLYELLLSKINGF